VFIVIERERERVETEEERGRLKREREKGADGEHRFELLQQSIVTFRLWTITRESMVSEVVAQRWSQKREGFKKNREIVAEVIVEG
jgi:hypothetical protein